MKIYYLGPTGSFSEQIAKKIYIGHELISLQTFSEIVEKVEDDSNSVGLLVIENSISSSVHQSVDLMFESRAKIIGEAFMEISLDLIGIPGTKINNLKKVYSHPQAFAQCSRFIKKNNLNVLVEQSTASAADLVKKSNKKICAAIGSKYLAKIMGLQVIESDVANVKHNMSRWIMIANNSHLDINNADKLTVIFKVKHLAGSLVKVLDKIAKMNGNLTKIESRPLPGTNWEYEFWADVEVGQTKAKDFLSLMKKETLEYRLLGAYSRGKLYNS